MARIKERKNSAGQTRYTVEVRIKGHPPATATFERKTDAKLWMQKTEAAMREGKHSGTSQSKKKTVSDLIERYISDVLPQRSTGKADIKLHLEWWKANLGYYKLYDLRPTLIAEYRDKLLTEKSEKAKTKEKLRSPATVVRYLSSLSVAVSYAVKEWAWMDENPVLKVRKPIEPRGRVRFLTNEERQDLLTQCQKKDIHPFLYPLVVLALSTGARWSELLNLKWDNIDLQQRMIRLEKTKNGERRSIPIVGHGWEELQQLRSNRRTDTPYLFPRQDGQKPMEIRKHWEKAVKDAKIEDFRFHDLRHTAASYLAMEGATLLEIADVLGHKQLQMVKRYAHLGEQHTVSVLEKMNARQFEYKKEKHP